MMFTLVGMPGSGKSCMSRALAGKLNLKTLDADRVIEARTGRKLHEIIAEDGIEAFRKIEEEILDEENQNKKLLKIQYLRQLAC